MVLGRDKDIKIDEDIWEKAIRHVYECGGYSSDLLNDGPVKDLIMATYGTLREAVGKGIQNKVTPAFQEALESNTFIFSGCKTDTELKEVNALLKSEYGGLKPWGQFVSDVKKVNEDYNQLYLRAEYRFAQQSATMASKWASWERRDIELLEYRTASDDRVRPEHAVLNGIVRPRTDSFWDTMMPPNGWRCRCTVIPVDPLDVEVTPEDEAMAKAESVNTKPKERLFRFNPGKERIVFPPKHPYYKAGDGVKEKIKEIAEEINGEEKVKRYIKELEGKNLTEEQKKLIVDNMLEIEQKMNIKKGTAMSVDDADKQSANPKYDDSRGYRINCQTCTIAYVLRTRGFNVTANANTSGSLSEYLSRQRSHEAWKDADGNNPEVIKTVDWMNGKGYKKMNEARYREYFEEVCKDEGIYILTIGWKTKFGGGGHATILQRLSDGSLVYVEPQHYNGKASQRSIQELCDDGTADPFYKRGIFRVDNMAFDVDKYGSILSVSTD